MRTTVRNFAAAALAVAVQAEFNELYIGIDSDWWYSYYKS